MRVCLVSRELSPFWGAGIGVYTAQMAAAWAAAGHEAHILTLPHPGLAEEGPRHFPGIAIHTLALDSGLAARTGYRFPFLRHAMAVLETLEALHDRSPFDAIEFPDYWAEGYFAIRARRTLGRLPGATLAVRLHTPTHECRLLNGQSWLDEELASLEHAEEAAIREADLVLSPSSSLLEQVVQRLTLAPGRPGTGVVPYPFALTPDFFGDPSGPAEPPPPAPTILYFGRLERRKGVHLLVEAAHQLLRDGLDLRVRFIGADTATGPMGSSMLEHLRSLAGPAHRDRFTFEGPRPRAELADIVRGITAAGGLCCFPSLWENFPNACVEAMALGAAVVGSDAGGMAEIIEPAATGLLFPSGDAVALAGAIRRLLADHALRASISSAAPARIASLCNPATVVARTIEAIDSARPAPAPARSAAPDFSILIPALGEPADLQRTFASIAAQTLKPAEVIALTTTARPDPAWGDVRTHAYDAAGSALAAGLNAAAASYAVWVRPGVALEPSFLERVAQALALNPGLTFLSALASPAPGLIDRIPLGLDRDLLPITDCAWSGAFVVDRRAALSAAGAVEWVGPGEEWSVCCALAERGSESLVIPEILLRGDGAVRIPEADLDRITGHIAHMHPALPSRPDRTLRLLAWQRARLRERAAQTAQRAAAAESALPPLQAQLARAEEARRQADARAASLRYRAADSAHTLLGRLGIRRPLRLVASLFWGRSRSAGESP